MKTQNFKHRLFVNEYNEEFVRQLINNKIDGLFCTDESTEDVLVITGTLENLDKLAGLMYRGVDEIKAAFPDFLTADDYNRDMCKMQQRITGFLSDELCRFITKYSGTSVDNEISTRVASKMLNNIKDFYIDFAVSK